MNTNNDSIIKTCATCWHLDYNGDDDPSYGCNHQWDWQHNRAEALRALGSGGRKCSCWISARLVSNLPKPPVNLEQPSEIPW